MCRVTRALGTWEVQHGFGDRPVPGTFPGDHDDQWPPPRWDARPHGVGAQVPTVPGTEELFNLEHVYNFNPEDHDPGRHASVGSDLEFFTHTVPLRDYETATSSTRTGSRWLRAWNR